MLVDLDKVKDIIKSWNITNGLYRLCEVSSGILKELDKLVYDKTWECLNCGKPIFYGNSLLPKDKRYFHVETKAVYCKGDGVECGADNVAIPKPEPESQDTPTITKRHNTCYHCGEPIYFGHGGWYHLQTQQMECQKEGGAWANEYRATPEPKQVK